MDSELVGTWKRTLEIQGFRRPAEYVPSAVASRSAEADHCKDGWKGARQTNKGKRKNNERNHQNSKEDAVVLTKAIPAEEGAEEAVEDAAEEETTVTI
jgi:hypothetical protein